MHCVRLSDEEKHLLETINRTSSNFLVRKRCQILLLSNKGRTMIDVGKMFEVHYRTVLRLIQRWESANAADKKSVLSCKKGQGAKQKLLPVKEIISDLLKEKEYRLTPLLETLSNDYHIQVARTTLANFLKERGLYVSKGTPFSQAKEKSGTIRNKANRNRVLKETSQ